MGGEAALVADLMDRCWWMLVMARWRWWMEMGDVVLEVVCSWMDGWQRRTTTPAWLWRRPVVEKKGRGREMRCARPEGN